MTRAQFLRKWLPTWLSWLVCVWPGSTLVVISVLTSCQQVANYVAATFAPRTTFRYSWLQHGRNCQPLLCAAIVGNWPRSALHYAGFPTPRHLDGLPERPGCVQMRPDSPFLQLNQDAIMLEQLNFTSIWTPFDLMIVPGNSSQMQWVKSKCKS